MRKKTRLEEMREAHRRSELEIRVMEWIVLVTGLAMLAWGAWSFWDAGVFG